MTPTTTAVATPVVPVAAKQKRKYTKHASIPITKSEITRHECEVRLRIKIYVEVVPG